jgi:hypothetical protein
MTSMPSQQDPTLFSYIVERLTRLHTQSATWVSDPTPHLFDTAGSRSPKYPEVSLAPAYFAIQHVVAVAALTFLGGLLFSEQPVSRATNVVACIVVGCLGVCR